MQPSPPSPPIVCRPTLPLPCEIQRGVPGLPSFELVIQTLLSIAETADKAHLMPYLEMWAYTQIRAGPFDLLLCAIDPATGDSLVHRAAAAGNIDILQAALDSLGPNSGNVSGRTRQLWSLITHQNLAGDTALHAAARAGHLRAVKAVYRMLLSYNCLDVDESLIDDETTRPESAVPGIPLDPPPEFWDWALEDDPDIHLYTLDFVCTKNRAGRDAAGEARAAGHEQLAMWIDGLITRNDRDGRREDEKYMRRARVLTLEQNYYHDNDEEK